MNKKHAGILLALVATLSFLAPDLIYAQTDCTRVSAGFVPLIDLPGSGTLYQGFQGGLYPNESNTIPAPHLGLGRRLAREIRPLDINGNPNPTTGRIVLVSIGMSNTSLEFSTFRGLFANSPEKNPRVTPVDGAQSGQDLDKWLDPNAPTWSTVRLRLTQAGVGPLQVQAAWVKLADRDLTQPFPIDALGQRDDLQVVLRNLKINYPNIKLAFLSSRIYGGYSTSTLSPEPYAYQHGFAVKWTIESQIREEGNINADPDKGPVVAPWAGWGPYLWADGVKPRSDGLVWLCPRDFDDGVHPSVSGRRKVASRLWWHFITHPVACTWFVVDGFCR